MLRYDELRKNEGQFLSITGMNLSDFDELHKYYSKEWLKYISEFTVSGEKRTRAHRKRKDGVLEETQDQLLFVLHYLKGNNIQEHHAAFYRMRQSQCNMWVHLLLKLLRQTLASLKYLPERDAKKLKKALAGVGEAFIDGVERDIQRPLDDERQRKHYSGKKNS